MANPLVKQFMEQYPNAKITVNHFTQEQSAQILENISAECGNPYITAKEYYRISIDDPDSGLKAISWVDWGSKEIECAVKYGGGLNKTISKPGEEIKTCKSHAEYKCYGEHVYWFDSCGQKEEKKEFCSYGCENGFCKVREGCQQHAEVRCYGGHLFWFDSCGNAESKKEYCANGCEEGACKIGQTEKTCLKEGESKPVIENPLPCCEGLTLIPPKAENLVGIHGYCTAKCGNGACDGVETAYNCPSDCGNTNCTETDGGRNYSVTGTATKGTQSASDHCNDDGTLTEKYCEDNEIKAESVSCPEGYKCDDARCIIAAQSNCTDSDGGKDYYVKGTAMLGSSQGGDFCIGNVLTERFCNEYGNIDMVNYNCTSEGKQCGDGKCIIAAQSNCSDSDGGVNYYVQGTATLGSFAGGDFCLGNVLTERFCNEYGNIDMVNYDCMSEGKQCGDSRCL